MDRLNYSELPEIYKKIVNESISIREFAYSPYSNFKVGAALVDVNGRIHSGCNIESADYTLTTHAEMLAIDTMVKSGTTKIQALAIALSFPNSEAVPCGLCRQKIAEFASNIPIITVNLNFDRDIETISLFTLDELLPFAFRKSAL